MARWGWFLILLWSLAACVSKIEPTETPFLIQRIALAPEMEGLISPWLAAFVDESGYADLKLDLFSSREILPSLETGRAELGLVGQEVPDGWFATPIWREAIAVVVNPEVKLESLDLVELADVFSGRLKAWDVLAESSDPVQPIIPLPGSLLRDRFFQVVMGNSSFNTAAIVGGSPDGILELVRMEPGAIGILPFWRVGEGVNVIAITGISPSEANVQSGAYPLWVDIVAVSPEEPTGHLREFLVWLQGTYLQSQTAQ